jgi:hypothetical protein
MAELLLVSNPKRRKHKRKGKMPAGLKKYWAARRGRKHAKRKHTRRSRAKRRPAMGYTVGTRKIRRRKLNPHRRYSRRRKNTHHRRHYRRSNPSLRGITGQIMPTVKAGAWGAAGALGLDVLWGLLTAQLPSVAAMLTNPYVGFAAKAAGAVTVGALGGKIARGRGRDLAVGAMTVVTHDFLKSLMIQMAPTIFGPGGSLSLGSYLSGQDYLPGSFGSYLSGSAPIVGTATIPQSYLPFAGSSGSSDGSGMYTDDRAGMDPWGG